MRGRMTDDVINFLLMPHFLLTLKAASLLARIYRLEVKTIKNSTPRTPLVCRIQSLQRSFNVPDDAIRMCGEILINIDK